MRSALAGVGLLALAACENAPRDNAPSPLLPTLAVASAAPNDNSEISTGRDAIELAGELTQGGWVKGQLPRGTELATFGDTRLSVETDGRFFAAFDRDAIGPAILRVTLKDGRVIERQIDVAPRAWNIEHVNVAKRSGGSSEASARLAVDLPVPRSPKTITPPIVGSTEAISSASFISSCPTIAENGKRAMCPWFWTT